MKITKKEPRGRDQKCDEASAEKKQKAQINNEYQHEAEDREQVAEKDGVARSAQSFGCLHEGGCHDGTMTLVVLVLIRR